jgi:peptidylprolyl isomerase
MSQDEIVLKSGLKYIDIEAGSGPAAVSGKAVTVHYTGTFPNGKKFDSSLDRNEPFTFKLGAGQVIKGWDEGVSGMRIGGKRRLLIPSALAYGKRGAGNVIPPDAELCFEVELLGVE